MTTLTIGIPTFNSASYLRGALDRIFSSTALNEDFEVLICDNASSDDTGEVVKAFTQQYPGLIRYIRHETNVGMDRNFWSVIENARGDYVHLHADDDYYTADGLKRIFEILAKHAGLDVLLLSNDYLNTHNEKILRVKESGTQDLWCKSGHEFFINENLKTLCLSNVVVRRLKCMEIDNIGKYFDSHWLHVGLLIEIVGAASQTYIFNYVQPVMTIRLGNQKWLENEGSVSYYYSALKVFENLIRVGFEKSVFEHIKRLFLPLLMNGGAINFTDHASNIRYCLKFLRFYYNWPREYLAFCLRLVGKKHRRFFAGWEKVDS